MLTTYPNYEKIKFSGKYNISNLNGLFGLKLEINQMKVFQLLSELSLLNNNKKFKMDTIIEGLGIPTVIQKLSCTVGTPNKIDFSLQVGEQLLEIFALIFTPEYAYSIIFKTPIEDYEEFTISGQFGSTSLKSIYSFKNHRMKRSVNMEYHHNDGGIVFDADMPSLKFKRFAFSNKEFVIDQGRAFSIQIQYNASSLRSSGDFSINLQYARYEANYTVALIYEIPDEDLSKGLSAKFTCLNMGEKWFSGKMLRMVGTTNIEIKTPIEGWRNIKLNMDSDWKTRADISFLRESRRTLIHLEQHGIYDYNITFVTPFEEYENIQITSQKEKENIVIRIRNGDAFISLISLKIEIYDMVQGRGSIEIKWDAANNIFVHINTSFDGVKALISIETSFDQVKNSLIEIAIQKIGSSRRTKAVFKINDEFLTYESVYNWTNELLESKSKTQTNFPFLGFKRSETDLKLEYSNDLKSFYKLSVETTTDKVVTFKTQSTLQLKLNGAEINLLYDGTFPLNSGKINALLHIDSKLKTKFELKGTWDDSLFHTRLILTETSAEAKFDSNLKNFEKLKGKAIWTLNKGPGAIYGVDINLENCKVQCESALNINIYFDTVPFSMLRLQAIVPGLLNESLILDYEKDSQTHSLIINYTGFKIYHLNATLNIQRRSVNIFIHNKSDVRKWRLKTNAEFHLAKGGTVQINVQLIVLTPFTPDFKAIVILNLASKVKQFQLTFKYGVIDASIQTRLFWSISESDILFKILCPSIGIKAITFEAKRRGFEQMKYVLEYNKQKWSFDSSLKIQSDLFDVSVNAISPLNGYKESRMKLQGNITGSNSFMGNIHIYFGEVPFHGSLNRKDNNIKLEVTSDLTHVRNLLFEANIEPCNQFFLKTELNGKKIEIQSNIDCGSFETKTFIETNFDICKMLDFQFIPKGDANFDIFITYQGLDLDINLSGNIRSLLDEKYLLWKIKFNDNPILVNLTYSIDIDNIKTIKMFYEWSFKRIEIISSLNTTIKENPHFVLKFKSPFKNLELILLEARLGNELSKFDGKLQVMFNNKKILLELGSVGNHLFLEARTPIPSFNVIKFDINHLENSVKTKVIIGDQKLDANFNRKVAIYNFDISSDLFGSSLKFHGKIDIASKALQTFVMFNEVRMRMKANSNGQTMSASLTSYFEGIRNVKVKGNWNWIENGFSVRAVSHFHDISKPSQNEFHAKFNSNANQTHGFWKVKTISEEILFNMKINKELPNSMGIYLSILLPNLKPIFCQINYSDDEHFVSGSIEFDNPWKIVNISFSGGFNKNEEFEFKSFLYCPEEIFNLELVVKIVHLNDVEFRIRCSIPYFHKDFGTLFLFKPHSLYNFQFLSILTINEQQFGGGASLLWKKSSVDFSFSFHTPILSGDYKIGGKYEVKFSTLDIVIYLNKAIMNIQYDIITGEIIVETKLNLEEILSNVLGPEMLKKIGFKNIHFRIEYQKNRKGELTLDCNNIGNLFILIENVDSRVTGKIDIFLQSSGTAKTVFLSMDLKKVGIFEFFIRDNNEMVHLGIGEENEGAIKVRKVRAAVQRGSEKFIFSQKLNEGVIILSTKYGIHKLTYEFKNNDKIDMIISIESPYFDNGFASASVSIDKFKKLCEGRFSINNDHFLYIFFKLTGSGLDSRFSLETTKLRHKALGSVSYNLKEQMKYVLDMEFNYHSKHKIHSLLDLSSYSMICTVDSPFIPFNHISVSNDFTTNNLGSSLYFIVEYGEHYFESEGEVSHNVSKGAFSFRSSQFPKSNFDANLQLSIASSLLVSFEIDTSIPNMSKFGFLCQAWSTKTENLKVQASLVLPFKNFEFLEINAKTRISETSFVMVSNFLTPHGIYIGNIEANLEEEGAVIKLDVQRPLEKNYFCVAYINWKDRLSAHLQAAIPMIEKVEISFLSNKELLSNSGKFNLMFNDEYFTITFDYDIVESYELSLSMASSIEHIQEQAISIGFNNDKRKMLKAHVIWFGEPMGLKLDLNHDNITSSNILLTFDNPLEDWTDFHVHTRSRLHETQMDFILSFKVNDQIFKTLFSKLNGIISTGLMYKKELIILDVDPMNYGSLTIKLPWWNSNLKFQNLKSETESLLKSLVLSFNGEQIMWFKQNYITNEMNLMVQKVFLPFYISTDFQNHHFSNTENMEKSMQFLVNMCWDTTNEKNDSLGFGISFKSSGDYALQAKLPGIETKRLEVIINGKNLSSNFMLKLSTINDSSSKTLFEHKSMKFKSGNIEWRTHKLRSDSFCIAYSTYGISQDKSGLTSVSWGEGDCAMEIGVLRRTGNYRKYEEFGNILYFPENGHLTTMSFIKKSSKEKIIMDIIYKNLNSSKDFSIKIVPTIIDSKLQLKTGILLGYSIGTKELRYIEVASELSKTEDSVKCSLGHNHAVHELQV